MGEKVPGVPNSITSSSKKITPEIKNSNFKPYLCEEVSLDACCVIKSIVPPEMQGLNQHFDQEIKGGEFSMQQLCFRDQVLGNGVEIRRDIGLNLYKVQPGDTLSKIRKKLQAFEEFKYLENLNVSGINSFNINPKYLQIGMLIPIPPKDSPSKHLTEAGFKSDCGTAIEEMKKNEIYGEKLKNLLSKISLDELRNLMVAVAKSECGGKLGAFATFRYEKNHKVFSYSVFHILMEGAGLSARRNLNLTEGQLEHPRNAAKVFLAFLFEKAGKKGLERFFPIKDHFENFASFYNGNWQLAEEKANDEIDKKNAQRGKGSKALEYPDNYPTKIRKFYLAVESATKEKTAKR